MESGVGAEIEIVCVSAAGGIGAPMVNLVDGILVWKNNGGTHLVATHVRARSSVLTWPVTSA
jgi:hypothetical protein